MRNQPTLADSVIIIEPSSFHLRISRAVDSTPKRFPHCIARKPKPSIIPHIEPIINRHKLNCQSFKLQQSIQTIQSYVNTLFNLNYSPSPSTSSSEETTTQSSVSIHLSHKQDLKDDLEDGKLLFDWEKQTPPDQDFYALNDAFTYGLKNGYHITWPIRYGFFSPTANYTAILQDLEDIWSTAIEKHIGIQRSNLSNYKAILVINDVYKRNEIRYLVHLLLNRLRFGRVFVHQASVCTTYGIGLPTACVINIGEQKTSISCVEDGIAHSEARVILPVGRSDVLRVFHSLTLPNGFDDNNGCNVDLKYDHLSDVEDLRTLLENSLQCSMDHLHSQQNERVKLEEEIQSNSTNKSSVMNKHDSTVSLQWIHQRNRYDISHLRVSTVLLSCILPFACISTIILPKEAYCIYQLPALHSSEPDDPFDDLYISLTARERRKRGLPNEQLTAVAATEQPDVEMDTTELAPPGNNLISQRPNYFESLPEAVWWSINQCANFVSSQFSTEVVTAQSTGPTPVGGRLVQSSSIVADEVRRRLLGCIILTGGGVAGISNQIIERWLTEQLTAIVREKHTTTTAAPASGYIPTVEIINHSDPADLSWFGARLLLTTDLLNDLWLTPVEWNRFGSRVLREKAAFLW
ncbi:unnamed protein product [Trichobilharzia szidati]|nr:unnamed protein product [Trichobilharzia szidati]